MRFRKQLFLLLLLSLPFFSSCDLMDFVSTDTSGLSDSRIAEGLKEALSVGIDSASSRTSKLNGYLLNEAIKIVLPPDIQGALSYANQLYSAVGPYLTPLSMTGIDPFNISSLRSAGDSLTIALNHAAEKAAPRSVNIFKTAIFDLTIPEAINILHGDSVAATSYLEVQTYTPLTDLYDPFVDSTLALVNANRLWQSIAQSYNNVVAFYDLAKVALVSSGVVLPKPPYDSLMTDLSRYTTQKALDGLFLVVGQEETRIRVDPLARVTAILREVFGELDKQ